MNEEIREGAEAVRKAQGYRVSTKREPRPFEHPHPHYEAMLPFLTRAEAVCEGMEDAETRKRFLPQFPFELDDLYQHRLETTEFLGQSQTSIERLTGAVFAAEPQLVASSEPVAAWLNDIDGRGSSLRDVLEEASGEANSDSIHYLLVQKVFVSEIDEPVNLEGLSRAQIDDLGEIRCALERLDARDVVSWGKNSTGDVVWAAIRQIVRIASSWDQRAEQVERWRVVTPHEIVTFEGAIDEGDTEAEALEQVSRFEHGIGRMPLVPVYGRKVGEFEGQSYIKASSRADIAKLREDSWGQQIRNLHGNPILKIKSNRKLKDVFIGGNAVRLEEDEDMAYVVNDAALSQHRQEAADRYGREAMRVTGTNPSFTAEGLTFQGESGVGQRERFTHTEQRYISRHTRELERAATEVLRLATIIIEDVEDVEDGAVSANFFNVFDVMTFEQFARIYRDLEFTIESPTFHRVAKRWLSGSVTFAATPDELQQIRSEIDQEGRRALEDDESGEDDPRRQEGA